MPDTRRVGQTTFARLRNIPAPVVWGIVLGAIQAASPLGFQWLDPATVYALALSLIAAIYIGSAWLTGGGKSAPSSVASPRCSW